MFKVIFLLSAISMKAYCEDSNSSVSMRLRAAESFNFHFDPHGRSEAEVQKWQQHREKIANEYVRRAEVNIQSYREAVAARDELVNKLREQQNRLNKLEATYTAYEKGHGSKAFEAQNMRTQMGNTLSVIETLNKDVDIKLESAKRSASRVVSFAQRSKLAQTITDQINLMRTPMGRNLISYANNPKLPNMIETIRGTNIGMGLNNLPSNLQEAGSIKTNNDIKINYRVNERIFIRGYDGGVVRGTIVGATAAGELIVQEKLPSGMQQLKLGSYRKIDPNKVSSIQIIRPSASVSLETLNNVEKFKGIGGRVYNISPTQTHFIMAVKSSLKQSPALNNQSQTNPARPAIGGGGMR